MNDDVIIKLVDVYKSFGKKKVLQGMNLDVYKGEILVIIGQSGIGKSVTLKLILGLLKPDVGHIYLYGNDITQLKPVQVLKIREKFGILFQSGGLLNSMTVGDNIALPLREHMNLPEDEIKKKVSSVLSMVGLSGTENIYPAELSGGMKKRAGLARALVRDPEIILYDEPTSGLDPVIASTINHLIVETNKLIKTTSIVVTHDMSSAFQIGDRIAMLYNGQILQVGKPEEFKSPTNPIVKQFVFGEREGPIQTDKKTG